MGLGCLPEALAAQTLEVTSEEVLIFSQADLQSDPLETASKGDLYRASDRSYRGFYKVELRKHDELG